MRERGRAGGRGGARGHVDAGVLRVALVKYSFTALRVSVQAKLFNLKGIVCVAGVQGPGGGGGGAGWWRVRGACACVRSCVCARAGWVAAAAARKLVASGVAGCGSVG